LLIVVCVFVLFLLTIVLSVLLRCRDSNCSFGIFKLVLVTTIKINIRLPFQMQYLPNGNATQTRLGCSSLHNIYGRHHELVDTY
jgi:hypothetical protein